MKILGRIILILIAALTVAGAATTLVGNSSARFPDTETELRPSVQDQPSSLSTSPESIRPPDRFHEGERDAPSLFGIVGVIQNLVIISFIVVVVTLGPRLKGVFARLTGSFHNI
jgi:hypothetical protein